MPAPQTFVDTRSNTPENIANLARAIGRSEAKKKLVKTVYTDKRKIKTVAELMSRTGLSHKRVLDVGAQLVADQVFHKVLKDGLTAYQKDPFVERYKKKILGAAGLPEKIAKIPTKSNPLTTVRFVSPPSGKVRSITVDDVDTFSRVRRIARGKAYVKMPEAQFKKGMETIIGEPYGQPDWGGEKGDLSTTRLRLGGKRVPAAFAFKGPGTSGALTPGKMGKRGDQIANLFEAPARIYFVQYWGETDPALQKHMQVFAKFHATARGDTIRYGVIDGEDSARLISAYPNAFRTRKRKKR